jgi:hypothetical protein
LARSLINFAVGIVCVLLAMVAITSHWVIAAGALGVGALAVLLWGVIGGKKISDADRVDADPERAKTVAAARQWPARDLVGDAGERGGPRLQPYCSLFSVAPKAGK